ncbi:MAG: phytoene/squalene synthase family protein [Pseudorhodoplanes sp.]
MPSHHTYCEELVRAQDRDRYLATLFAPAARRGALFALHAFDLETAQVAFRVREPLAGEIRLQWWREAIEGPAREQGAGHPVAAALLSLIDARPALVPPLLRLLEARRAELQAVPFAMTPEFRAYARAVDGGILQMSADLLDAGAAADIETVLQEAGTAAATARLLSGFAAWTAHGKTGVPGDILARHGVHAAGAAGENPSGFDAALADWALQAGEALDCARAELAALPRALWPAFLPLAGVRPTLAAALHGEKALAGFAPPAWRRQWRLWRVSRDLPRRL